MPGAKNNLSIEVWPISRILPYEANARRIPVSAVAKVALSLREFGWRQPIVVEPSGVIVVGHVRRLAAIQNGWLEAPVHVAHDLTPAQLKAYRLMDNRSHDEASWDNELLGTELLDLKGLGSLDLTLSGFELGEIAKLTQPAEDVTEATESLAERFGVPPFSILDARQGYWQSRKKAWLALGIKSELGRGGNLLKYSETCNDIAHPGITTEELLARKAAMTVGGEAGAVGLEEVR